MSKLLSKLKQKIKYWYKRIFNKKKYAKIDIKKENK